MEGTYAASRAPVTVEEPQAAKRERYAPSDRISSFNRRSICFSKGGPMCSRNRRRTRRQSLWNLEVFAAIWFERPCVVALRHVRT